MLILMFSLWLKNFARWQAFDHLYKEYHLIPLRNSLKNWQKKNF